MKTTHRTDCTRVFKRYDPTCPRCQQLADGEAPRSGWGELKRRNEAATSRQIAAHFAPGGPHARGACGQVCTAFEW